MFLGLEESRDCKILDLKLCAGVLSTATLTSGGTLQRTAALQGGASEEPEKGRREKTPVKFIQARREISHASFALNVCVRFLYAGGHSGTLNPLSYSEHRLYSLHFLLTLLSLLTYSESAD